MPREEAPYIATIEISIWEWEHRKATHVFQNLCDDVAKLSHRTYGGSHSLPPPRKMTLEINPAYVREDVA